MWHHSLSTPSSFLKLVAIIKKKNSSSAGRSWHPCPSTPSSHQLPPHFFLGGGRRSPLLSRCRFFFYFFGGARRLSPLSSRCRKNTLSFCVIYGYFLYLLRGIAKTFCVFFHTLITPLFEGMRIFSHFITSLI